jgi:hypothetical protein
MCSLREEHGRTDVLENFEIKSALNMAKRQHMWE